MRLHLCLGFRVEGVWGLGFKGLGVLGLGVQGLESRAWAVDDKQVGSVVPDSKPWAARTQLGTGTANPKSYILMLALNVIF